jgi:hypothetical protein
MTKRSRAVCAVAYFTAFFSFHATAQELPQGVPQEPPATEKGVCIIVGYIVDKDVPEDKKLDRQPLEIIFTFDGKKVGKLSIPSSSQLTFPCTSGNHAMNLHVKRKYSGVSADCTTGGVFLPGTYTPWVTVPDRHGSFNCRLQPLIVH